LVARRRKARAACACGWPRMGDNAGFICSVDGYKLSEIMLIHAQCYSLVQATLRRETCTGGVLCFHRSHPFPMSSHRRTGCIQILPATCGAASALLLNCSITLGPVMMTFRASTWRTVNIHVYSFRKYALLIELWDRLQPYSQGVQSRYNKSAYIERRV